MKIMYIKYKHFHVNPSKTTKFHIFALKHGDFIFIFLKYKNYQGNHLKNKLYICKEIYTF